jgi:hypothetical protein
MVHRYFRGELQPLEVRAALAHLDMGAMPEPALKGEAQHPALVGSIEGTETVTPQGFQIEGTGTVMPLGDVTVTGFFGGGTGALNDTGTLTLSNGQGRLTLSMKTHGFFETPR